MQIEPILQDNNIHEFNQFDIKLIKFEPKVRNLCEQNSCGSFKRNHMCPPAVDSIEKWKNTIQSFEKAVMVTKVYLTKSSFDIKAMQGGLRKFEKTLENIKKTQGGVSTLRISFLYWVPAPVWYAKPAAISIVNLVDFLKKHIRHLKLVALMLFVSAER